jgi:putative DNA methylase
MKDGAATSATTVEIVGQKQRVSYPKRLIEVDLPIKRISAHARREKSIRHGHISTLHIWWARRPLAACRAVICAALWPDPADPLCPQVFREKAAQLITNFARQAITNNELAKSCSPDTWAKWLSLTKPENQLDLTRDPHLNILRFALLDFIADFANWDNSTVREYLDTSRALTHAAHAALGGAPGTRPLVVDPFAGGGSIPLEALRVGADAFASDLNPVSVLLNKVVLEYIPKYGHRLADEVRKWGQWIKREAEKELAEFYPKDADGATPIAYLWARTIQCEGPGCGAEVPLIRSFWLSKKANRSVAFQLLPNPNAKRVDFQIILKQDDGWVDQTNSKTKIKNPNFDGTVKRGSATCPCCGYTTPVARVREQFKARRGGANDARLMCVVQTYTNGQGRSYRLPTMRDLDAIRGASIELDRRRKTHKGPFSLVPEEPISLNEIRRISPPIYGMSKWGDLFSARQNLALATIADRIRTISEKQDVNDIAAPVQTLLAFALDRQADYNSSICRWVAAGEFIGNTFGRQAIPMVWDFCEVSPLSLSTGGFSGACDWIVNVLEREAISGNIVGQIENASAAAHPMPSDSADAFITDPPYYDAVPYSHLADFFYVWLRRSLGTTHTELFKGDATPKSAEIVVDRPHVLSTSTKGIAFYESELAKAFGEGRRVLRPDGVGTIVFASKTTASWEAILKAVVDAGWIITGSWPIDTEMEARIAAAGQARLASSVHLVCRPRENSDGSVRTGTIGDWRDVLQELPRRIHEWMPRLAEEGVVGADAIFACLGPALEIFSRYERVEKASGDTVTLKEYLEYVWAAVAKEALTMVFKGADASGFEEDARLTAMWLWTLFAGEGRNANSSAEEIDEEEEEAETANSTPKGYILEYDAARKIAQGLGARLESLTSLVEVKGESARLLPVTERTRKLFGRDEADSPAVLRRKKTPQLQLGFITELEQAEEAGTWGAKGVPSLGATALDRVHQSMILFAASRGEALRRFLVDEGVGRDERFWRLAQVLSYLYPPSSEEKRWIDGVLARKKGLGF